MRLLTLGMLAAALGCAPLPAESALAAGDTLEPFDAQACAEDALRRSPDAALLPGGAALMVRGCAMGDSDACSIAGVIYELGRGAAADRGRARSLYERACVRGNARGCGNLGELLVKSGETGRGRTLLDRACTTGHSRACVALGIAELDGDSSHAASAAAQHRFERACGAGEASGCVALADLLERSAEPGDRQRAFEALRRACARGDERGCDRLARRTLVSRERR